MASPAACLRTCCRLQGEIEFACALRGRPKEADQRPTPRVNAKAPPQRPTQSNPRETNACHKRIRTATQKYT
eukprot:7491929-Pyramimonas_sp.AAC.1